LAPRSVLEKLAAIQMIDVHIPTSDGRELVLTRYTEPEPELKLLLDKLRLELPASRHRRDSSARCSCRVVPSIRDARFVNLILAIFTPNSVRRQERVCRAQRLGAKIYAVATSVGSRDRTSRI
jgi:hypothetical protein